LQSAAAQDRKPGDQGTDTPVIGQSTYYPTKVGSTWTYRVDGRTIVTRVTKHEKVGKHMCALVETLVDGKVTATEHIAITKDEILRVSYNGQQPTVPVCFLKLKAKVGETWKVETTIGKESPKGSFTRGEEDIDVPAFKGKAITSDGSFETNGVKLNLTYWFAPGKGIVKQSMSTPDGKKINIELVKFEEGGAVREVGKGLDIKGELNANVKKITYQVKLVEGKTYQLDMTSKDLDAYLILLDAMGKELARDDDGGEGLNSRIVFRAEKSGTYQIVATSFQESGAGPFALSIREVEKD
jgi:hypothetical protein